MKNTEKNSYDAFHNKAALLTNRQHKITEHHLQRLAYVYVRQSTLLMSSRKCMIMAL